MIHSESNKTVIEHPDFAWQARHDSDRFGGPREIRVGGDCIVRDVDFYVDDFTCDMAVLENFKAFRKGGTAVVTASGHFPFGGQLGFTQTCRYAANHVRVSLDVNWRPGCGVRRHFGVGSLFLPGRWLRYFCLPPCQHLAEGKSAEWHTIPEAVPGSGMIGHWHRPPLALVFEREDGTRVEVGTGSDIWRWERNLGFGPEAASYKIMLEADGLRFLREPLMTCEEVFPEKGQYRFTWYMAWGHPGIFSGSPDDSAGHSEDVSRRQVRLDLLGLDIPGHCRRLTQPVADGEFREQPPCWSANPVQKAARRMIRKLAGSEESGDLILEGLNPGPCWDAVHVGRGPRRFLPHWDMDSLLDFAVWTRQVLGHDWRIQARCPDGLPLPSVQGLFACNGFGSEQDEQEP